MPVILTSRSGSYRDGSPSKPLGPCSLQLTTCCKLFSVGSSRGSRSGQCSLSPCVQGSNSDSAVAAASRGQRYLRAGKMWRLESVTLLVTYTIGPTGPNAGRGSIHHTECIPPRAMRESASSGRRRGVGRSPVHGLGGQA